MHICYLHAAILIPMHAVRTHTDLCNGVYRAQGIFPQTLTQKCRTRDHEPWVSGFTRESPSIRLRDTVTIQPEIEAVAAILLQTGMNPAIEYEVVACISDAS